MSNRSERMVREPPKVALSPLAKEETLLEKTLDSGSMVAVVSNMEVMYVLRLYGAFQTVIHRFNAEEGRHKTWEDNERNRAMFRNLTSVADHLFSVGFEPGLNPMGVMEAAEKGIIAYLDATNQLPAEDTDFMEWLERKDEKEETE